MSNSSHVDREAISNRVPGARVYRRERSSVWQIQYRENGRKVRLSSGLCDEDEAWLELDRVYTRKSQLSVKEAVVNFFEVKKGNLEASTISGYLSALKNVDSHFGSLTLAEIDLDGIKGFVADRRTSVSDTTVRRELAFLSSVFTFAQIEMVGAPETNPFVAYSKRHLKEKRREYYLTPAEFDRLLSHVKRDWQRTVLLVAVHTGMRHQELCGLRKEWINWDRGECGEIQLPRAFTKSKKSRIIPILPEISDTLYEWTKRDDAPWVFSHGEPHRPYTSFQGFFRIARKNAKLEGLRFHDLRHTFASWWVQRGGKLLVLRDILGHATLQMVERYAHLDTEAAHREAARLTGHTQGHTGEKHTS